MSSNRSWSRFKSKLCLLEKFSMVAGTACVLLLFACGSSQPNTSQSSSDDPSAEGKFGSVPELDSLAILQWNAEDQDALRRQHFKYTDSQTFWLNKMNLKKVISTSIDHKRIEAVRKVSANEEKGLQAAFEVMPDGALTQLIAQLERESIEILESIGISLEEHGNLTAMLKAMSTMTVGTIVVQFDVSYSEVEKEVLKKYAAQFPFAFETTKIANVHLVESKSPLWRTSSTSFDEASQTGTMTLELLISGVSDSGLQEEGISESFRIDHVTEDGRNVVKDSAGSIRGCIKGDPEYSAFSVCDITYF